MRKEEEGSDMGLPYVDLPLLAIVVDFARKNSKDDELLRLINRLEDTLKNEENKNATQIFIDHEVESIINELNDYFSKHKEVIAGWGTKKKTRGKKK